MAVVRTALLIIFGAAPASYMCYFAALIALNGIMMALFEGSGIGLLSFLWGAGGILGTFSLWRIILGHLSPLVYWGLICGVISAVLAPVLLNFGTEPVLDRILLGLAFPPVFVALYLLAELLYRTRTYAKNKDEERKRQKSGGAAT